MLSAKFNAKALSIAVPAIAAYGLAVFLPATAAAAPTLQTTCLLDAAAIKVSKTEQTTTDGPVPVIDGSVSFVQGGKSPGCVVVSFSAEAKADADTAMYITATLDDGTICQPGDQNFFARSNATATDFADRAMNYVCTGVAPGAHRAKLMLDTDILGKAVTLGWRTLIVHYFK
jgi:hypothetical protein